MLVESVADVGLHLEDAVLPGAQDKRVPKEVHPEFEVQVVLKVAELFEVFDLGSFYKQLCVSLVEFPDVPLELVVELSKLPLAVMILLP